MQQEKIADPYISKPISRNKTNLYNNGLNIKIEKMDTGITQQRRGTVTTTPLNMKSFMTNVSPTTQKV